MSDYEQRFQRYEKKYLMTSGQYHQLRLAITGAMQEDAFGTHTIGNIYYDNENYELIRKSIESPLYKEKLRVRSYGNSVKEQPVFVELKKKFGGVVYKRRVRFTVEAMQDFLSQSDIDHAENQIQKEILWFMKRYGPTPKIYVGYERTAYSGLLDAGLRLTIDRNIRFRTTALSLKQGFYGEPLIAPEAALLEIKSPGAIPLWLCRILSDLEIYPVSFSKVGRCYQAIVQKQLYFDLGEKRYA